MYADQGKVGVSGVRGKHDTEKKQKKNMSNGLRMEGTGAPVVGEGNTRDCWEVGHIAVQDKHQLEGHIVDWDSQKVGHTVEQGC